MSSQEKRLNFSREVAKRSLLLNHDSVSRSALERLPTNKIQSNNCSICGQPSSEAERIMAFRRVWAKVVEVGGGGMRRKMRIQVN